jgi:hypothetical protein
VAHNSKVRLLIFYFNVFTSTKHSMTLIFFFYLKKNILKTFRKLVCIYML